MFCPPCCAEYRPGFTDSTDCDVDLVDEAPPARTDSFESSPGGSPGDEEDPFCPFWQGDHARLHAELSMVLEEAGIPHKTVRRQDHLFNLKNSPAFQMGVPFSLFEKAETAVQDAYATDASGADAVPSRNPAEVIADRSSVIQGLPETLTPSEEENMPGPPDGGDEAQWKFAHGGVEVWSGEDPARGDMLVRSLRENKIRVHRETSHGKQSLLVSSGELAKAREIVKQVVKGLPPG